MKQATGYSPSQEILGTVQRALHRLESFDPAPQGVNREVPRWDFSALEENRRKLREKLIAMGPQALRTLLKYSWREADGYREDVYLILQGLVADPIELFLEGLGDGDSEIRWSCMQWLREKAPATDRLIPALLNYMKNHPYEGDVPQYLGNLGPVAVQPLVEFILEVRMPMRARLEAVSSFPFKSLDALTALRLNTLAKSFSTSNELKSAVTALLRRLTIQSR